MEASLVLDNIASLYLKLPPSTNIKMDGHVHKLLRTKLARYGGTEVKACLSILGQLTTNSGGWIPDAASAHKFSLSTNNLPYGAKKRINIR